MRATAAPADDDGSAVPPVLAGLVLALGAIALLWTFRPGRRRSGVPSVAVATAPDSGSSSGTAPISAARAGSRNAPPAQPAARGQAPRPRRAETLLLSAAEPPAAGDQDGGHDAPAPAAQNGPAPIAPAPAAPRRRRAAPPDPRRAWSAEIEWAGHEGEPRFAAVARSGQHGDPSVIAESPPLQWPPAGPAAVQALTDAVTELERALLAAGWTALEPGSAWYAKRFGWKPRTHVATPPVRTSPRSGRFDRSPAWPQGTEELWRCELRWDAGVVNSRFEALAYGPGSERPARPLAASAGFKWLMLADPNPAASEFRAELRKLAGALEAAGWEPAGRGAKWYSARFLWRRDEPPPDRVEVRASETRQSV